MCSWEHLITKMIDFLTDIGIQKLTDHWFVWVLVFFFFLYLSSLNVNHLGQAGIYLQALMGLEQSYQFVIQNAKRGLKSASVWNFSL